MDIIAIIAFGIKLDSQRDPNNIFIKYAKEVNSFTFTNPGVLFASQAIIIYSIIKFSLCVILDMHVAVFFPWITRQVLKYLKIRIVFGGPEEFFSKCLNQLIKDRRNNPLVRF